MARFGFDNSGVSNGGRPAISLHPAFSVIVATWFAALLGVGSLVLPGVLLDHAVGASGLAALIPAATPPLGAAARGAIALAAALAGAAAGSAIAGRVARSNRTGRCALPIHGAPARRPISISEELGGELVRNGSDGPVDTQLAATPASDTASSDGLCTAALAGDIAGAPAAAREVEVATQPPTTGPAYSLRAKSGNDEIAPAGEPALEELVERLRASIQRRRDARSAPPPVAAARAALAATPAGASRPAAAVGTALPAGLAAAAKTPASPLPLGGESPAARPSRERPARWARPTDGPDMRAETDAALRMALATLQRMSGRP